MNRIRDAMEQRNVDVEDDWVPPWYTGEAGYIWPAGRILTPQPCSVKELERRADLFRSMGYEYAASAMEIEILKRGEQ